MCLHSIHNLNIKKQYYLRLLKTIDKFVTLQDRQDIQKELKTLLVSNIPSQDFKKPDDFYNFDFIKEIQQNSKFSSMKCLSSSCKPQQGQRSSGLRCLTNWHLAVKLLPALI